MLLTGDAEQNVLAGVKSGLVLRPLAVAGMALLALTAFVGLVSILPLIDIQPWEPSNPTTMILPGLAVAYLLFGALRRQLRRTGVLRLQVIGLIVFGGFAVLCVLVEPEIGHYVLRAAWIGHAAWDVAHHRDLSHHHAVGVVPRGYAELCIVVDLLIGASLIAAPVT